MRKLFYVLIITMLSVSATAEFVLSTSVKMAYSEIYSLHLNSAERWITRVEKENRSNNFIPFLRFNVAFTKIFVSEDPLLYESLNSNLNDWIDDVKDAEDGAWKSTCLTEMYMLRSALKLKFGKNIKSGFDGIKAYNTAEEGVASYPEFKPLWLSWGLMKLAIGSVPDNYKGLISAFGYSGDIDQGLELIKGSWMYSQSEGHRYLLAKSALIYGYTSLQLEQNWVHSITDLQVKDQLDSNNLLVYLQAKFLQEQKQTSELIQVLENREKGAEAYPFYYLDFMEGKAKVAAQRPDAAVPFQRYLENYKGKNFIKAIHYQLAMHYLFQGNAEKADYHKLLVFTEGNDFTGADKMALFMADRNMNETLLKAQAQYDNAQYNRALETLESGKNYCQNAIDSTEMFYRLGRVHQALGNELKAIIAYKEAVQKDFRKATYYGANSSLQLAKMLEQKEMNASARYYYKLTLQFRNYPFQDGIQQKAKAGKRKVDKE
ncbi:MAG: hypothetical protein N4A46_05575 [Schleiferiaceae bacterium]|nr:hypothetical protein [Schleiferiaceae bacterium]